MTIRQYLRSASLTIAELAEQLGVHPATIYRWLKGHEIKSGDIARLVEISGGKITANEVVGIKQKKGKAA